MTLALGDDASLRVMQRNLHMKRAFWAVVPFSFAVLPVVCRPSPAEVKPRTIQITAKRFAFEPAEITLKQGEPVELTLRSVDVGHGLRFRELGMEMKAKKGQTSEVQFTPEKAGTFVGHCDVFCGSGHGTMELTLHVVR